MRILLALLVLVIAGCRPAPRQTVFIDPAFASLIPADTVYLAGVRVDTLRKTPAYKRWVENLPLPGVDRFREQTGLDVRENLWQFLIAGNGKDSVVFGRGKFSEMGMEPRIPGKRFSHRGYTLTGDERSAVTFLNSTTVMLGPTPLLRHILDNRDSGGLGVPASLQPQLKALPAGSQLWVAGDLGAQLSALNRREHGNASNFSQFAGAIESGWAGFDFADGMNFQMLATCRTEQDAQRLHSTVRAAAGMGRLSTAPEQTELLAAWDSIQAEIRDGRTVAVNAKLNQAQFNAMVEVAGKLARGLATRP